ncbi:6-phosphofructokinase [Gemmiger sp. An120]|uniref:diphosphate--fructose-6-phosphate 1-phosphotransferase n=1 Tax=Gemmiger TaxID=204475 RepID=UPI000B3AA65D|nr:MULTISPECIES: diphosphate--fructose-6-phosphate 1-phosphotransferase [Gemmiger]MBM6914635.1 diphosphate--fructose-6-phosphate 1-phosphotransferase [Gemmiger formicilis]OUQ41567.1 6-phosphofructokinase [Gemmiger sp. An120]HIX32709.1 diphosphate--fructose-6-phosphate 1-phosphotransferase [Candidatus Gemmiger avium]
MKGNVLLVHGGAPTAVINASLYGAVTEAKKYAEVDHIYAAIGGSGAVIREQFLDMKTVSDERLELLLSTPASAIGTSRDHLEPEDYEAIARVIQKHDIKYVFFNGGNGSMDACGKVYKACQALGLTDVRVVGIPKTIDNDIAVTDHAPGFGSAARYIAATVSEVSQDVRALPIHVSVVEAMGRNAGWIAAASALARSGDGDGPDLIYLPERPFVEEEFLADVKALVEKKGGVVVVASEGLTDPEGKPIVEPIFQVGRATYYGDVSAHLANLVIKKLGYKARSEKPGICGRASIAFQSSVDRDEAVIAGAEAVKAAMEGQTGVMIGFERLPGAEYKVKPIRIPIEQVMLTERTMPAEFINERGNDVTDAFVEWCRPLIGEPLRPFVTFKNDL